jgi:hypothetical protein
MGGVRVACSVGGIGAAVGGIGSTVGGTLVIGVSLAGATINLRMVSIAVTCVLSSGASGDPAAGFWRHKAICSRHARIVSADDAVGIFVLVGNHFNVSQMRVALVSQHQTRWHR